MINDHKWFKDYLSVKYVKKELLKILHRINKILQFKKNSQKKIKIITKHEGENNVITHKSESTKRSTHGLRQKSSSLELS